jgi:hypothetical protein
VSNASLASVPSCSARKGWLASARKPSICLIRAREKVRVGRIGALRVRSHAGRGCRQEGRLGRWEVSKRSSLIVSSLDSLLYTG